MPRSPTKMNANENRQLSLPEDVIQYYEMGLEAARFSKAEGALEFARTQEIIERHLPPPPAVILDVGGGPGTYAAWLAHEGYQVHLIDPVPLHLDQAREASRRQPETPISTIARGDARRLDQADDCADAMLLLGPLYHLTERSDRLLALREAYRVLKPGGLLIAVAISRFASILASLIRGSYEDARLARMARQVLREGQHRNPTGEPGHFTTAFLHHPQELRQEVREAGFSVRALLAVEGPAVFLQDLEEQWQDPARRQRILEIVRWSEDEPSMMGVTGHIAAVAVTPE